MNKIKIYLIPGLMNDERLWSRLIPLFQNNYEFIFLKIPHFNNFDFMVDFLNEQIKEEKINLIGFSLGGYIASYFACKYPNRINKLSAIACTGSSMSKSEIEKRKEGMNFIEKYGFKGLSRKKVISLIEEKNQNDEELISLIQAMYVDLGENIFKMQIESTLIRKDLSDKLKLLEIPILFIYSNNDRLVNPQWMEKLKLKVKTKNIKFNEIDSSSHMLPLERALEVYNILKEWIK